MPERANSEGMDLEDAKILSDIAAKVAATPAIPADIDVDAATAIAAAEAAWPGWSATPVDERAACLERLADLLEQHRAALMAIAVQEAKKTIPMRSPKCARRSISAAIMRRARVRTCSRSNCRGRPVSAMCYAMKAAVSGRRSRRGTFRWQSFWGR
jgi:acyl-CoA reductase-like NAD-dependent aldehyde dehydrogenase